MFGKLPELFRDEDELREIWGDPDTRRALIDGLAARGFAEDQLDAIRQATDSNDSDLFDVLAYIAYLRAPLKRVDRAAARQDAILSGYAPKQRDFLAFVLSQYVAVGKGELDIGKLPDLLSLRYGSSADAVDVLGNVADIRLAFRGFQRGLYQPEH